jgi:hypothetical protein
MKIYIPPKMESLREFLFQQLPAHYQVKFKTPKEYGQDDNRSRYRAWRIDIDSSAQKSAEERSI